MKIRLATWKIKTLNARIDKIDPSPQYQRTSVWSESKKKLLIDSVLRGYDVPKFYLRATPNSPFYDYEVTDGQQRIRAITEFMSSGDDKFFLESAIIRGVNTKGLEYSNLGVLKDLFDDYDLNIAIIEDSNQEEIRSLFARLQMGSQLNQVELRHAMSSNLGSSILSIVESHPFFKKCKIPNTRFKHQDYLDHVFTLIYNSGRSDLKAKNIEKTYRDLSDATSDIFTPYLKKVNQVLDWMHAINNVQNGLFKNKWGFVDVFWLLYKECDLIDKIDEEKFVEQFKLFERRRLSNHRNPDNLIVDPKSPSYDFDLYNYITAFKYSGNLGSNISTRNKVFRSKFINNGIYLK
ncbi:DUF262 domain-containing protein [Algoriphagus halophytocola]|uniref:DUF262 domain-containing protein n=1 Tax=Algoriphagus halophytocola TaxID=2991499 RepID=A0ABY6MDG2_9BACT|nr:DUF262 domain-containing protein [Algoriphagus sp. TR-M5]UZD21803.1 DUF262 domain-containing protein [Algoriphagus sp. TR-M5]